MKTSTVFQRGDRPETRRAARGRQDALAFAVADRDKLAQAVQRRVEIAGLLGHNQHAVAVAVLGERLAEPVQDAAARRGNEQEVELVVVRHQAVAFRLQDLKCVETRRERAEHDHTAR